MKKPYHNPLLALMISTLIAFCSLTGVSEAQLVLVESRYRIVDVDHFENRISVALPEANPDVGQTWIYLDRDTRGSKRDYYGDGYFRDKSLSPKQILKAAEKREGELIKVHGGRDWDGSITAKSIWM